MRLALALIAADPERDADERRSRPRVVMNISLGGAPGPKTGGMTDDRRAAHSGRAAVNRAADREKHAAARWRRRRRRWRLPDPKQKPRTPPKHRAPSKDPKGTSGRARIRDAARHGTRSRPGAKGQGFGLSTGGGGGDGGVKLGRRRISAAPNTSWTCVTASSRTGIRISGGRHRGHEVHDPAQRANHRYRGRNVQRKSGRWISPRSAR